MTLTAWHFFVHLDEVKVTIVGFTVGWVFAVTVTEQHFSPISLQPQPSLWVMKTSVQAAGHGQRPPQTPRTWRCCCVEWPADESQVLQEWDFLPGSPLQLDTETAVNQRDWLCVDMSSLWASLSLDTLQVFPFFFNAAKKWEQLGVQENISFILTNTYR